MHKAAEIFLGSSQKNKLTIFSSLCCLMLFSILLWHTKTNKLIHGQNMKILHLNRDRFVPLSECSHTRQVSCMKLIAGDPLEINKTTLYLKENFRTSLLPESFPALTNNCQNYRRVKSYINISMSDGERQFPIAFSLLVFKHAEQVERLLRAIWRPQNVYCIHVDNKSTRTFKDAIKSISKCFDNIIVLRKTVDVHWGTFTVLEPELLCLEALWKHKTKWKYFINLTGQEFPLKTNYELYRILQAYNGANDIEGAAKRANRDRWRGRGSPPHNIKPRKGSVHIAASRNFVNYLLHNKTAQDLLNWVKKTGVPDETFFATLNQNPHLKVPGSYDGDEDDGEHGQWNRYKIWYNRKLCSGKFVRAICIFSIGDLKRLTTARQLFANKFNYDYDYLAYDCLEAWYYRKIEDEKNGQLDFNTTIYKNRRIVSHHF